jgi:hypothetical protein
MAGSEQNAFFWIGFGIGKAYNVAKGLLDTQIDTWKREAAKESTSEGRIESTDACQEHNPQEVRDASPSSPNVWGASDDRVAEAQRRAKQEPDDIFVPCRYDEKDSEYNDRLRRYNLLVRPKNAGRIDFPTFIGRLKRYTGDPVWFFRGNDSENRDTPPTYIQFYVPETDDSGEILGSEVITQKIPLARFTNIPQDVLKW